MDGTIWILISKLHQKPADLVYTIYNFVKVVHLFKLFRSNIYSI